MSANNVFIMTQGRYCWTKSSTFMDDPVPKIGTSHLRFAPDRNNHCSINSGFPFYGSDSPSKDAPPKTPKADSRGVNISDHRRLASQLGNTSALEVQGVGLVFWGLWLLHPAPCKKQKSGASQKEEVSCGPMILPGHSLVQYEQNLGEVPCLALQELFVMIYVFRAPWTCLKVRNP